ncbi:MAG: hypothetical protein JXA57_02580 [Armatimonadetes bacterium]|nr:hypothetical protein [Armatimonadota bacterium]
MFRRWAEARMWRRTMQIAVSEMRRAARTANVLDKLQALDIAEQKLRDAQWLSPDENTERFETGVKEIQRSRRRTLEEAASATERLLEAAEKGPVEGDDLLRAAGKLLSFLNHYQPDDARVEVLSGRFVQLGGVQPSYEPVKPLADMYDRSEGLSGCGVLLVVLLLGVTAGLIAAYLLR